MSKREKIIVSIMAAAVLISGYLYLDSGTSGSLQDVESKSDEPALGFTQKVLQKLKEDTALTKDMFIMRSAERQWERDPFLKSATLLSDTQQENVPDTAGVTTTNPMNLVYTGFIEAGNQRLAIINGTEYAPGEAIDEHGHYIRRIESHRVEIGKRNAPDVIILKLTAYEAITGK